MAKLLGDFSKVFLRNYKLSYVNCRNIFFRRKKKKPEKTEFNQVYKLMEEHFFPQEPTIRYLGSGYKYHPVFERQVYETLEYGYSYIAKCKWTGCIVGACLNFTTTAEYPCLLKKFACMIKDEDIRNILLFYAYIHEAPEIFNKYCENEAFVVGPIAVDNNNRNLKIATELVRLSRILGRDMAFPIIRCDSSSFALSKICEDLGMDWEHEVKYCEYLDENGEQIFDPPPPNTVVSTYIDLPLRLPRK